jgi:RNA polymerase primary sigma factor
MDWSELQVYMQQAKKYPLLSREEEIVLARQIKKGGPGAKAAREQFLNANLRLVVSMVGKFKYSTLGVQDLVQEGNIGLMRALTKFDPERGFKFSTYASWWIRQAMMRASQQADPIRIPVHQADARNLVKKVERYYDQHFDRDPTDEEVADATGLKPRAVGASLDDPSGDGDATLASFIEDEDAEDAELAVLVQDLREQSGKILDELNERDRLIFMLRYGEEPLSLEEIGDKVGLTRERVRQILGDNKVALQAKARKLGFG